MNALTTGFQRVTAPEKEGAAFPQDRPDMRDKLCLSDIPFKKILNIKNKKKNVCNNKKNKDKNKIHGIYKKKKTKNNAMHGGKKEKKKTGKT